MPQCINSVASGNTPTAASASIISVTAGDTKLERRNDRSVLYDLSHDRRNEIYRKCLYGTISKIAASACLIRTRSHLKKTLRLPQSVVGSQSHPETQSREESQCHKCPVWFLVTIGDTKIAPNVCMISVTSGDSETAASASMSVIPRKHREPGKQTLTEVPACMISAALLDTRINH